MKTFNFFKFLSVIFILNLLIIEGLSASWQKKETKGSMVSGEISTGSASKHQSGSDSLPPGVTKDWLNSLTDENGNRIIPDNQTGRNPDDPEIDAVQRKVFNGLAAGGIFGYSVGTAGDVNGDGYDDIIVGAYGYNSSTGRVYIYYGGVNMNTLADVILTGEATNSNFGSSVSTAGDVNGDGYSDVIVGADGYASNTGRAYIFFGGSSMNNTVDVTMTGEAINNYFGVSVSAAGDVNGDGYSDVIAGADGYASSTGRAYIFFGGSSMNNAADVTMTGELTKNSFGYSVSRAGDVNGDGYSDVIAGAGGYASNTGRAYIFFGGSSMNNTADVTMTGELTSNYFGISVASGDVNGDGYSDVIVGASGYASNTGRAYIYFGGSSMNNTADVTMTGETTTSVFGRSVSAAGDVNGDGYSDVIAGADGYASNTGRAYIFFGESSMNNTADVTLTGESTVNYFGASVSVGDVNGDGYSDVIVGASGYNSNTGRVYLYDYFMKNEIIPDVTMTGEATGNYFGNSVSTAGDVNGDGYADVIVGANAYSSSTGRAYIYFGGATMNNVADVTMTGEGINNYFATSVSTAGDVNGDGYSDVIVGAHGYFSSTGRAYIYFGGTSMNNIADVTMTGEAINNIFGVSVSTAGDVNGDGYADVIVGAYVYSSFTGRAYIYFGGSAMNNIADVTMTGEAVNNYFGASVSTAGDVNGDGYADVIVGAEGYASNTGRAYIFFGGSAMNNVADVTMTGQATSNYFGFSVSTAGDVNGDGYADVIVGAYGYSSYTGRAYIFFGGLSMNNVADVTMTGEATGNSFGAVSTAGDVNGDGYADIIVGASEYSSYTGRAYIYFGGSAMNNIADVTMTGEAINNSFGFSVSTAGDVNGDGYADVIVGAYGYSSITGRSYIYLGSAISVKPILLYVKDVPNDQGGKLNLKWARSSNDVIGNNTITDYLVYRSYPPNGGGFSWELKSTVPATKRSFYTFTDNTPFDSSSGSSGNLFYQIMAKTSDPSQFWLSGILSGRSIDNIAPLLVSPFTAAGISNYVSLNWKRSTAPDLLNYIIYRSVNPTIDPDTEPVFATTTDSTYLDTSPLSGTYYYFIVAQDIHNNKSPVAVAESPNITLNLTMFIEGFYNAGSNSQVSDTITVELRKSISPFAIVDVAKAVVTSSGNALLKFGDAPSGQYYIVVKHRNSIETWSKSGGETFTVSGTVNYNLSTTSSQAFGNNIISVDASPVRFAVYSGDVNQDGSVDVSDVIDISNDAANFVSGYVVTDVTGDDFVDSSDLLLTFNNSTNFVSVITP